MSSSSYGVLVTCHNSMSSCKFWKIFSTLLTLHFVSILILWFCYLSVEIKIGIVGINRYFFSKVCIYKEVKNTESSYVGVGYTDCLGQKVGFVSSRYIDTSLQPYPLCLITPRSCIGLLIFPEYAVTTAVIVCRIQSLFFRCLLWIIN